MSQAQFNAALAAAATPVRTPRDLALLESADPMSLTLATLRGGQERVQRARDLGAKLHIAGLIASALRGE